MKKSNLKFTCLIAALYFGININAQEKPGDTAIKEQKIEEIDIKIEKLENKIRKLQSQRDKILNEE